MCNGSMFKMLLFLILFYKLFKENDYNEYKSFDFYQEVIILNVHKKTIAMFRFHLYEKNNLLIVGKLSW